jgi:hypothetical protein
MFGKRSSPGGGGWLFFCCPKRIRTYRQGAVLEHPGGAELVEVEVCQGRVAAGREEREGEVQPVWGWGWFMVVVASVCMCVYVLANERQCVRAHTHHCCSRLVPAAMRV